MSNPNEDLAKILDAITIGTDLSLATTGDKDAYGRLVEKAEDLPESIKTWVDANKDKFEKEGDPVADPVEPIVGDPVEPVIEPVVEPVVEPVTVEDPTVRPVAENFEDEIEFAKALVAWDTATKAKQKPYNVYKSPVREDFFSDAEFDEAKTAYDGFVSAITKNIFDGKLEGMEVSIGDVVKKSVVARPAPEKVDLKSIWSAADKSNRLEDLLMETGVLK